MITYDEALESLKRAVALKGEDYLYQYPVGVDSCEYKVGGAPACIVGHVLADLAPDFFESVIKGGRNRQEFRSLVSATDLDIEPDASLLLAEVQWKQDNRMAWGEALEAAINYVEEV